MSTTAALIIALALTAGLVTLHLAAPAILRRAGAQEAAVASFAAGTSVAYVFLHLLPELAEGNEAVAELLGDVAEITPLQDLGIFVVALVGFTVFHGLERWARASRSRGSGPGMYGLHVGSFSMYNALITYTTPLRVRTGLGFAVLFTVAMGLHFVLVDRGLEEHYGERFDRAGRLVLAAALVVGWVLAWAAAPTRTAVVSVLVALLAGSILLNVFKEEIPPDRRSSFPWFLVGAGLYAGLLAVTTAAA